MRVLVTGASGFVGKNLLAHPAAQKHDILSTPHNLLFRLVPTIFPDGAAGWKDHWLDVDCVIHLAGRVGGIQDNINAPSHFLCDNLRVGLDFVQTAARLKIPRLINIGSSCMYPVAAPQPFREESLLSGPVEPTNEAYAMAKLAIMRLCQWSGYKTLIPPGLYGPHAHFEGDKAHMVSAIIDRLHKAKQNGDQVVSIWGDGTAQREFLFAPDLADCIWRAVEEYDSLPDVMNVGEGVQWSVGIWTHLIAQIVGYEGRFDYDFTKPQGAMSKVMDVSRADKWGWQAKTGVEKGLRLTYDWYLANYAG